MPFDSTLNLERLFKVVQPTTIIDPFKLKRAWGLDFIIASETFQVTGSFKFRAAYNLALNVENDMLITASSGNFGQALACACNLLNKRCIVVMPTSSAKIKVESTKSWGAEVDLVDTKVTPRAQRVAELAKQHPQAYVASAYDDPYVIDGNASLGYELGNSDLDIDAIIAPIGGGGLCSGLIKGIAKSKRPNIQVFAAEPALANDAAKSIAQGTLVVASEESSTIADGARTLSLGKRNFEILNSTLAGVIEVTDAEIIEAVKLAFTELNLKVEPTGALSLAALKAKQDLFKDRKVVCVLSGGNVDPEVYARIISSEDSMLISRPNGLTHAH